jgi:hypothetical protein
MPTDKTPPIVKRDWLCQALLCLVRMEKIELREYPDGGTDYALVGDARKLRLEQYAELLPLFRLGLIELFPKTFTTRGVRVTDHGGRMHDEWDGYVPRFAEKVHGHPEPTALLDHLLHT